MTCCRCNRTGTCRNCSCHKAGSPCSNCLPGKLGNCRNLPSTLPVAVSQQPSTSSELPSSASTVSYSQPCQPSAPLLRTGWTTEALTHSAPTLPPPSFQDPNHQPPPPINRNILLPSLDSICGAKLPTLQHIPKGSRDTWAGLVANQCYDISQDPSNLDAWRKFFMLPRCILANPARGGRTHWRETQKLVKSRIRRWQNGEFSALWDEVLADWDCQVRKKKPKKPPRESLRKVNARRARRAVEDGQYRKAIQALSSEGLANVSPKVLEEMLAKHPQSAPPPIPPDPTPSPPNISEEEVLKALRSFPGGSAPGPSSLRANHLREAVLCPSPDRAARALRALSGLVRILCAGRAPQEVIPHLCGATLLATKKKDGGLRPIAVGEVLRRLTSKCLSHAVREEALATLTPLQVGVGVELGCEAIVHSVSRVLEDPSIPSRDRWTLLLDFSNAFNSIDRGCMFEEIRARIPSLAPWMESCYGAQSILHLGDEKILSCCGVQQGDPLGPLGFALTLQPIVEKIKAEVQGLKINAWYLDDGTLCGPPDDLATALRIVEQEGATRGLNLNRAKSLLYISGDDDSSNSPLPSDIPITTTGFTLLGCPIGPPTFCEDTFSKRTKKVKESLTKLPDLEDAQMETTLLRSCLALPKVSFSLRTCPPDNIKQATATFDEALREAVSDLAGSPLSDWAWLKASLPSSRGGLNIRRASLHAPAAYISSLAQSRDLVARILGGDPLPPQHMASSISALAEAAERPDWASLEEIDVPLRQRPLSYCIDEAVFDHLLQSSPDDRSKALTLSTSLPHAGDWLNVIPSTTLGLHLQDKEFRCCLQYWLGLRMSDEGATCPICQGATDPYGDHQVGCGGNGDRIYRHDSIRDAIFSAAQSAALAPRKEVPSLIPNSSNRPADVYLPIWKRGQPAALDVTVISTMQQQTLSGASTTPGHALRVGEERKMAAHAEACRAVGVSFLPLVVESLGGWSQEAILTIASIGRLQGQRLGIPPADSTRHLFQRLAISLWRGNASLWIRRQPTRPAFVDGLI